MNFQRYDTCPTYRCSRNLTKQEIEDADDLLWSGSKPPPEVNEAINVRVNGIGPSIVVGYASEAKWLGVLARPLNPPDWWIKQNGTPGPDNAALVYGAEIGD